MLTTIVKRSFVLVTLVLLALQACRDSPSGLGAIENKNGMPTIVSKGEIVYLRAVDYQSTADSLVLVLPNGKEIGIEVEESRSSKDAYQSFLGLGGNVSGAPSDLEEIRKVLQEGLFFGGYFVDDVSDVNLVVRFVLLDWFVCLSIEKKEGALERLEKKHFHPETEVDLDIRQRVFRFIRQSN